MDICELRCYLEHDCVSINFGAENDGGNRCELSDSDHFVHPGDLKDREGFIYRSVENFCTSNPCSSNGRCQTGFGDKGHRCICSTGYTGEHCSTGIIGHVKEKPGNSCKHIMDTGSSKGNGEYWIDLGKSGDPLKVCCDLTTDGEIIRQDKLKAGISCGHILDSGSSEGDWDYCIDLENSGVPIRVYCDMTTTGEEKEASGIVTDMSDVKKALEEILEKEADAENILEVDKEKEENSKADEMRNRAMESMHSTQKRKEGDEVEDVENAQPKRKVTRKSGTDTEAYLREKNDMIQKWKAEELKLQVQHLDVEKRKRDESQRQHQELMQMMVQEVQQQMQQFQQMFAAMQQQQSQIILRLLGKH
ncbi:hypothetical protein AWC38_SpisGene17811 [Stylophora pistillata]|uniref:EGF-like domain-containing protein n=1 Tax=Stylophora pistillata TaxID=50429 RepID=A0A2B4RNL4_STYPI|nr:hypothetical protein AWC38_SpisGene17811 [Stylophora pistillata]